MSCFIKASQEIRVDTRVNGTQNNPAVTALDSGGFVVTWTDNTHLLDGLGGADVMAQVYDAAGQRISGEFLVNTETIDHQRDGTITGLQGGRFVVVWQDFSGRLGDECGSSIKAKVFGSDRELVRDEFLVNVEIRDNQADPAVAALSDGGFVVAWHDFSGTQSDDNVKARLFGPDGGPASGEFLVNTHTKNYQGAPSVASLNRGGFVVAWNDFSGTLGDCSEGSIKAKLFSRKGETVRDEFLVNTRKQKNQSLPVVAALENGGFVVAWTDWSGTLGDSSSTSIKARMFDDLAVPLGDEFLVNTETSNCQLRPALAPLKDGGFVVVWTDHSGRGGDASGSGIKGKVFGPRGTTVQDEFLVNTETEGDQNAAAVAGLVDGSFVVSWQDASIAQRVAVDVGDLPCTTIKAQIFTPTRKSVGAVAATVGQPIGGSLSFNQGESIGLKGQGVSSIGVGIGADGEADREHMRYRQRGDHLEVLSAQRAHAGNIRMLRPVRPARRLSMGDPSRQESHAQLVAR